MNEVSIIHSVKFYNESDVEPLLPEEVKGHIPLDFPLYDGYIESFISAARSWAEKYTGISMIEREIKIVATLYTWYSFQLPYYPVKKGEADGFSIKKIDANGTVGSALTTGFARFGANNEQLSVTEEGLYEIVYKTERHVTADIKAAIKAMVAYLFEHRGEEFDDRGTPYLAQMLLDKYKTTFM